MSNFFKKLKSFFSSESAMTPDQSTLSPPQNMPTVEVPSDSSSDTPPDIPPDTPDLATPTDAALQPAEPTPPISEVPKTAATSLSYSSVSKPNVVQQITVFPAISKKNHAPLVPIIATLKSFQDLIATGNELEKLMTYSTLSDSHIKPILLQIDTFLANKQESLAYLETRLTEATKSSLSHPLDALLNLCTLVSRQNFSDASITHDDFIDHQNLSTLRTHLDFCKELISHSHELDFLADALPQINEINKVGYALLDKIQLLTPAIQEFKITESNLREEIIGFTTVVNKLQSQPGWESKRESFAGKKQELNERREAYLQEETKINQAITVVTQNIPLILQKLKALSTPLLPLIKSLIDETPIVSNEPTELLHQLSSQITVTKQTLETITETSHQLAAYSLTLA